MACTGRCGSGTNCRSRRIRVHILSRHGPADHADAPRGCLLARPAGSCRVSRDPGLAGRLLIGAVAGFVGTMAMTAAMNRLHRRLPAREKYPLPPREIIDAAAPEDSDQRGDAGANV